ncbi:MAG: type I-U CRISPR-associated protein Csx17 [Rhodocyclaceae bacterium]|nr:type I-U CRISPR-associated protein Csx17 [Rhodocyclaceae bacterium]
MHLHKLQGCTTAPLANYLKALGIFRLVAQQADSGARAWWQNETFMLSCELDATGLEQFFLDHYRPTPILSPWNKGAGFFKSPDPGLTPVEQSQAQRFLDLREGIRAARGVIGGLQAAANAVQAIKDESKDKSLSSAARKAIKEDPEYVKRLNEAQRTYNTIKSDIIPIFRMRWRGAPREWLDAALVLDELGAAKYPALLGTGGNDGRLDFTNNFLQRLNEIYDLAQPCAPPRSPASAWLRSALWASAVPGNQPGRAVGQYLPAAAGGANSCNGPDGDSLINPFDFVLMLEGTLLFASSATRRMLGNGPAYAAAPFALPAQGAGYASSSDTDSDSRGEQWMPVWANPTTLADFRRLLAEGRAQLGTRAAREPLDLARAVARLGVARGIAAFERYGYLERNGQSNFAVPLGRYSVPERDVPTLANLDDLDAWLPRLRRQAREKNAAARLRAAERALSAALFALTSHADEAVRWQSVLLALAEVEAVLSTGSGSAAGPIPRLRPQWVAASDDGSAEFRLALAFALQAGAFPRSLRPLYPVRQNWLTLNKTGRFETTGEGGQNRLRVAPEAVLRGRSGIADAIALVERRHIDAARSGARLLPLVPAYRATAHASDIAALLGGQIDLDRSLALARALMALDSQAWARQPVPVMQPPRGALPDDGWLVLRLAMLPWPIEPGRSIGCDPAVFRRLAAGDAAGAVELALRRLAAAGVRVALRFATAAPADARLWAAALAFPVARSTARDFMQRLDPHFLSGV